MSAKQSYDTGSSASPLESGRNFDLNALARETMRTLANIDFEHDCEMQNLYRSRTDADLKSQIAENLRAMHQQRREPYARLVAELHRHIASSVIRNLDAVS
jgi:hypothetical protein